MDGIFNVLQPIGHVLMLSGKPSDAIKS
jgi:hypothetical protein